MVAYFTEESMKSIGGRGTGSALSTVFTVRCLCGEIYCFNCGEQWHAPISCDLVQAWNSAYLVLNPENISALKDEQTTRKWILGTLLFATSVLLS